MILLAAVETLWEPPKIEGLQEFLKPPTYGDADNPIILSLASEFAHAIKAPREASMKVWDFVVDINWCYEPPKSNMSVLRERNGNCMNKSNLLITLNRLLGIPARFAYVLYSKNFVKGYIMPAKMAGTVRESPVNTIVHVAAEVYLDGKWILCDQWCDRAFIPYPYQWNGHNDLLLLGPDFVYGRLGHTADMPLEEFNEQFRSGQITKKFCRDNVDPFTEHVRALPREKKIALMEFSLGKEYADNFARQLYLQSVPYPYTAMPDPKPSEPSPWLIQKKIEASEVGKKYLVTL